MEKLINLFNLHGDLILIQEKFKPILTTRDFNNKYIKRVPEPKNRKGFLKVFSWDDMRFRFIVPRTIKKSIPLKQVLKNA